MRTTRKQLDSLLQIIAKYTNQATTREEAKEKGLNGFLWLDYAPIYGGYRVVKVGIENGAHYGALGFGSTDTRLSASLMYDRLHTILTTIDYISKLEPRNEY